MSECDMEPNVGWLTDEKVCAVGDGKEDSEKVA